MTEKELHDVFYELHSDRNELYRITKYGEEGFSGRPAKTIAANFTALIQQLELWGKLGEFFVWDMDETQTEVVK